MSGVLENFEDGFGIHALRGAAEAQNKFGPEMCQDTLVGVGRRMAGFVNDQITETVGGKFVEAATQTLHGGKKHFMVCGSESLPL